MHLITWFFVFWHRIMIIMAHKHHTPYTHQRVVLSFQSVSCTHTGHGRTRTHTEGHTHAVVFLGTLHVLTSHFGCQLAWKRPRDRVKYKVCITNEQIYLDQLFCCYIFLVSFTFLSISQEENFNKIFTTKFSTQTAFDGFFWTNWAIAFYCIRCSGSTSVRDVLFVLY